MLANQEFLTRPTHHVLERHTGNGTVARLIAHELEMHGACVFRMAGRRSGLAGLDSRAALRTRSGLFRLNLRVHGQLSLLDGIERGTGFLDKIISSPGHGSGSFSFLFVRRGKTVLFWTC
jgi:hypothetical protein